MSIWGFGIWDLGFGVWGAGFEFWGLGGGVWGVDLGSGVGGLGWGVGCGFDLCLLLLEAALECRLLVRHLRRLPLRLLRVLSLYNLGFGVWASVFRCYGSRFVRRGSEFAV